MRPRSISRQAQRISPRTEAPVGDYSGDTNYFANAVTNGPLTAPSSSSSGGNGVYAYGSSNPFPNSTFSATNYWVDVVFTPGATQAATAPTGFTFAPAESSLQTLQSGGSNSRSGYADCTFTETGGVTGDSFTYILSGSNAFTMSSSVNKGTLSTGSSAVAAGTKAALSIQVNDITNGTNSGPLPFEVVVGTSGADTINLSTLGIAASTPTFLYGLAGADTLNGSGMTGPTWFVGGAGADTMTGGSGADTYLYAAAGNSTPSALDIITNFNAAVDRIDLTGIGPNALSFLSNQVSSTIAARSIGWQQSGGNTFVYVNTSTASEALGSANMEIRLNGTVSLVGSDVLHN